MPMMRFEQHSFALSHLDCLVGSSMIVTEDVQDPVHDQQRDLIVEGSGMIGRLACRNRRADHDVTEQQWHLLRICRCPIRTPR